MHPPKLCLHISRSSYSPAIVMYLTHGRAWYPLFSIILRYRTCKNPIHTSTVTVTYHNLIAASNDYQRKTSKGSMVHVKYHLPRPNVWNNPMLVNAPGALKHAPSIFGRTPGQTLSKVQDEPLPFFPSPHPLSFFQKNNLRKFLKFSWTY